MSDPVDLAASDAFESAWIEFLVPHSISIIFLRLVAPARWTCHLKVHLPHRRRNQTTPHYIFTIFILYKRMGATSNRPEPKFPVFRTVSTAFSRRFAVQASLKLLWSDALLLTFSIGTGGSRVEKLPFTPQLSRMGIWWSKKASHFDSIIDFFGEVREKLLMHILA